ncbi:MAG: nicotinamide riboside transporter PnuC [Lachnospiraceae bacterium]|nr:nicotinamide riboside transporter PnuC [Lachnospiraceae bacterium]
MSESFNLKEFFHDTFKSLRKRELFLWIGSMIIVTAANIISSFITGDFNILTLAAALIGVTSLIFAAKGHLFGPLFMVFFSILYGIISLHFRYWGEMITYLGMTLPMSVWALIAWYKHPSEQNKNEVKIASLGPVKISVTVILTAFVTVGFYFILKFFNTPNLIFSTISIATSFAAAALTLLRSPYYALLYAANDIVLIILWLLASFENPTYISVIVNFAIFLINDSYGFISWMKRKKYSAQ